jgi:Protein of unknown function (DUF1207)
MRKPFMTLRSCVSVALALLCPTVIATHPALAAPVDDIYIHGYAAAILEREFGMTAPSLRVAKGVVTIDAADLAGLDRPRLLAALASIRGVARVEVREPAPPARLAPSVTTVTGSRQVETGWLPEGRLFDPLIADPRWPHFSAAYHYYIDDERLRHVGAVSFGETFSLYRWNTPSGWWEAGLQAGVFAIFDLSAESTDLINADYFAAAIAGYRYGDFSALGRLFHQSSHLGDEFLLSNRIRRVNLSYEGVDVKLSYEFWRMPYDQRSVLRLYAGAGYLFNVDPSSLAPWSTQVGVEVRSPWPFHASWYRPIAALDVQNREENDWSADVSVRAGFQFDGVLAPRNLQLLLEYFRGRSPNGQFYREKVDYLGVGAHFHF